MDQIDYLRSEKRRIGGTPARFSVIEITGKPGLQYSVDAVYGPALGLWDSVSVCMIDDITGQQCSEMEIVSIGNVCRILSF